ncbi:MAG: PqqD family protein [Clostridia bacterium]|nr:PqqD family protein [Clostridia bacterium]
MKIANGFKLKILQGKDGEGEKGVIVTVGEASKKLNGIISLNEQATLIFKCIDQGLTKEQIVAKMLEIYDVDEKILLNDVEKAINSFKEIGAIND